MNPSTAGFTSFSSMLNSLKRYYQRWHSCVDFFSKLFVLRERRIPIVFLASSEGLHLERIWIFVAPLALFPHSPKLFPLPMDQQAQSLFDALGQNSAYRLFLILLLVLLIGIYFNLPHRVAARREHKETIERERDQLMRAATAARNQAALKLAEYKRENERKAALWRTKMSVENSHYDRDPVRFFSETGFSSVVFARALYRCEHTDELGVRCQSSQGLAVEHIYPWHLGGWTILSNAQLVCEQHHTMTPPSPLYVQRLAWARAQSGQQEANQFHWQPSPDERREHELWARINGPHVPPMPRNFRG